MVERLFTIFLVNVTVKKLWWIFVKVQKMPCNALKVAHDECGHFGVCKTYLSIQKHFFWPCLKRYVSEYIKTCHVYQLTGKWNQGANPTTAAHSSSLWAISHLMVDCVGPPPCSKYGCKNLLSVMSQSTRYPAAYPLRSITTNGVVKALSQFILIFGIPEVVQSDQGQNFSVKCWSCCTLSRINPQLTMHRARVPWRGFIRLSSLGFGPTVPS